MRDIQDTREAFQRQEGTIKELISRFEQRFASLENQPLPTPLPPVEQHSLSDLSSQVEEIASLAVSRQLADAHAGLAASSEELANQVRALVAQYSHEQFAQRAELAPAAPAPGPTFEDIQVIVATALEEQGLSRSLAELGHLKAHSAELDQLQVERQQLKQERQQLQDTIREVEQLREKLEQQLEAGKQSAHALDGILLNAANGSAKPQGSDESDQDGGFLASPRGLATRASSKLRQRLLPGSTPVSTNDSATPPIVVSSQRTLAVSATSLIEDTHDANTLFPLGQSALLAVCAFLVVASFQSTAVTSAFAVILLLLWYIFA
jgi:hypothetical protein